MKRKKSLEKILKSLIIILIIIINTKLISEEKIITTAVTLKKQQYLKDILSDIVIERGKYKLKEIKNIEKIIRGEGIKEFDREKIKEIIIPSLYYKEEGKGKVIYMSLIKIDINKKIIKRIVNIEEKGREIEEIIEKIYERGIKKLNKRDKLKGRKIILININKNNDNLNYPLLMIYSYMIQYCKKILKSEIIMSNENKKEIEKVIKRYIMGNISVKEVVKKINKRKIKPNMIIFWKVIQISGENIYKIEYYYNKKYKKIILVMKDKDILKQIKIIPLMIKILNVIDKNIQNKREIKYIKNIVKKIERVDIKEIVKEIETKKEREEMIKILIKMLKEEKIKLNKIKKEIINRKINIIKKDIETMIKKTCSQIVIEIMESIINIIKREPELIEYIAKETNLLNNGIKFLLWLNIIINEKQERYKEIWKRIYKKLKKDKLLIGSIIYRCIYDKNNKVIEDIIRKIKARQEMLPIYEQELHREITLEKVKQLDKDISIPFLLYNLKKKPELRKKILNTIEEIGVDERILKYILEIDLYTHLKKDERKEVIRIIDQLDKNYVFGEIKKLLKEMINRGLKRTEAYKEMINYFFNIEGIERLKKILFQYKKKPEEYKDIIKVSNIKNRKILYLLYLMRDRKKLYLLYLKKDKKYGKLTKYITKEGILDMTKEEWCNLSWRLQIKLASLYQEWYAKKINKPLEKVLEINGVKFEFRLIPPGIYYMGSLKNMKGRNNNNERRHKVKISKPYYLSKYEVTKEQWYKITGEKPWRGYNNILNSNKSPAVYISWKDIKDKFLYKLNKTLGKKFKFPTEAQWEYACRSGTTTKFYWGNDLNYTEINKYAWYRRNTSKLNEKYAHEVGLKKPNGFGLYDMSGNVWEWCYDRYDKNYGIKKVWSSDDIFVDPYGPFLGRFRVLRSGSWDDKAKWCYSTIRCWGVSNYRWNSVGFRIILSLNNN